MGNEIKYIVTLKWAKPTNGKIQYRTKLAEFIPMVVLKDLNDSKKRRKSGTPCLRSRVFLPEFIHLAKALGFQQKGNRKCTTLEIEDSEPFFRLLVYAVVRQTIKSETNAGILSELVKRLPYLEIRYWANIFCKYFREYKSISVLYKPARSFKEVYGIS